MVSPGADLPLRRRRGHYQARSALWRKKGEILLGAAKRSLKRRKERKGKEKRNQEKCPHLPSSSTQRKEGKMEGSKEIRAREKGKNTVISPQKEDD